MADPVAGIGIGEVGFINAKRHLISAAVVFQILLSPAKQRPFNDQILPFRPVFQAIPVAQHASFLLKHKSLQQIVLLVGRQNGADALLPGLSTEKLIPDVPGPGLKIPRFIVGIQHRHGNPVFQTVIPDNVFIPLSSRAFPVIHMTHKQFCAFFPFHIQQRHGIRAAGACQQFHGLILHHQPVSVRAAENEKSTRRCSDGFVQTFADVAGAVFMRQVQSDLLQDFVAGGPVPENTPR